jgi:TonB family protein
LNYKSKGARVSDEPINAKEQLTMCEKLKMKKMAASMVLAMVLSATAVNLAAQEGRKVLSNPTPAYPEIAKRLRLEGVVKVQVVIGTDGRIKETNVVGGHPLLVTSVEETLKNWKYAPASSETTALLEFRFHP